MFNYYEILGLSSNAGILEIKAAFRQLAKRYHPDLNPEGIEHFNKILKAYETLSDPALKSTYDYKLQYQQSQSEHRPKRSQTKNWSFDEKELKRRQYYNDHIKKYAKETSRAVQEMEGKKTYNEFKYILFATPLAVLLFLLIMSLATRDRPKQTLPAQDLVKDSQRKYTSDLKMGDAPYEELFGTARYDLSSEEKLHINNMTGTDIVVCLFSEHGFIRSFFIEQNFSAEVSQLPKESLWINYYCGKYFDASKQLKKVKVKGAFSEKEQFFKSIAKTRLNSFNELTLLPGNNEGFITVEESEFFKFKKLQP